jgi:hypothetical protein
MNKSALGKEGAPFELCVERGKIREFARAVEARHPDFERADRALIPPTFLTTAFHWEADVPGANPWSLLEVDQTRGLHAEQEYTFFGPPPRAGDRLEARSRIESIYEKEGRRGGALTFAVMITEFFDVNGALVAEARLTGVETAKAPTKEPSP